jgi:Arc/MetJ-type ribon-helix-helix transcriptional regulator
MPSRFTVNASLTPYLCDFVAAQVASGRFGSASEVVRAGLRLLERDLPDSPSTRSEKHDGSGFDSQGPPSPPQEKGDIAVQHRKTP